MKSLIIGYGEIGQGLHKVVGGDYIDIDGRSSYTHDDYDVMHICFPYSKSFISDVEMYMDCFTPKLVIVHSTTPMGTCDKLGVVHSPVRGVHPNIDIGIKTFVKYLGGQDAHLAAKYFKGFGVKTKITKLARTTEALKLWDTTQYGMMILLNKNIKKFCTRHGVDFDLVYTDANKTYNEGYRKLGRDEVVRPYLKYVKGKIGGHCVVPNARLLDGVPSLLITLYDQWSRIKN